MDDSELISIERAFWFGDAALYREQLTPDFIMIVPGMGIVDRDSAIAGIEGGPRWNDLEMKEERILMLGAGGLLICYRAEARRGAERYQALVSSAYRREDGRWRLAFHQHNPLSPQNG